MNKQAKKEKTLLWVSICEARPNKLFSEEQRQSVRFLIYNKRQPCAECGRKVKRMWTMLCQFRATNMIGDNGKQLYPPLTPVCGEHPLSPAVE